MSELASRLGCAGTSAAVSADGELTGDRAPRPDLVVVVLRQGSDGSAPSRNQAQMWEVPAAIVRRFVDAGAQALALSSGACPVGLALCAEQGATVVFDLDHLPAAIEEAKRSAGSPTASVAERRVPRSLQPFCTLTAGERRVLFGLAEGASAEQIANDQTVSLATIRTHIRSILRKLDAKSQLAAVALVNGVGIGPVGCTEVA
jgi:DNA-binding CsgD family transcriptional regulator